MTPEPSAALTAAAAAACCRLPGNRPPKNSSNGSCPPNGLCSATFTTRSRADGDHRRGHLGHDVGVAAFGADAGERRGAANTTGAGAWLVARLPAAAEPAINAPTIKAPVEPPWARRGGPVTNFPLHLGYVLSWPG